MNKIAIWRWLKDKGYPTDRNETGEYLMYYDIDMPRILNDFADYITQQPLSGSDDKSSSPKSPKGDF